MVWSEDSQIGPEMDAQGLVPEIEADGEVYDFGTTTTGSSVKHVFVIRNVGKAVLKVKNVRATCGCTVVTQPPKELAAGQEAKIPVELSTKSLRGKVSKTVHVTSNDPSNPKLELKLIGEVATTFDVLDSNGTNTRSYARLGQAVEGGLAIAKTFTIVNKLKKPLELTGVESSNKRLRAAIKPSENGRRFKLTVMVDPPFVKGAIGGNLLLKSKSTAHGDLNIRVALTVVERVRCMPSTITVRRDRMKEVVKPIWLINSGSTSVSVKDAGSTNGAVNVKMVNKQNGRRYRWNVTIPPDAKIANNDKVVILTDDKEYDRLEIQIKYAR
jgi:hypothetical protein